ncbi:MAG: hypothetical protein EOM73_09855, partial [Bacteroidia bacterium]|nr:hypothetical protein [Bacteroidia bacterium]
MNFFLFRIKLLVVLFFTLCATVRPVLAQPKHQQAAEKQFFIGVDNSGDKFQTGEFFNYPAMEALGVDFISYKYRGPKG